MSAPAGHPARRVIFVDFGGVISEDEYWLSLREDGHPLKARVDAGMTKIWHDSPEISQAWMRGQLRFAEVLFEMGLRGEDAGFLKHVLQEDARRMDVHPGIAGLLPAWAAAGAEIVAATDNTAPFAAALESARAAGGRRTGSLLTMAGIAPWFSAVVCSCDTGCLKREDAGRFFGPALRARGLGFGDALLIDDRADNCAAFARLGGTAVRWHLLDDVSELAEPVRTWLTETR